MNFAQKLSDIFNSEFVKSILDSHDDSFAAEVNHLMLKNGGEIPLRRQINDYYTFSLKDQNQETIIIKKSETKYSSTCTCKEFQINDVCAHIICVLTSIYQQITEENKPLPTSSAANEAHTTDLENVTINSEKPYIIYDASNVSYQKMVKLFPFLSSSHIPKKTQTQNLDHGLQVVSRSQFEKFYTDFIVNKENNLEISCSCKRTYEGALCEHAKFAVGYVAHQFNATQFNAFLNLDVERAKILEEYGLSQSDPEAQEFKFAFSREGKLELVKAPQRFKNFKAIDQIKALIDPMRSDEITMLKRKTFLDYVDPKEIGFCLVFDEDPEVNIPITIEPYRIETNKKGAQKITKLPLSLETSIAVLSNLDDQTFDAILDFGFDRYKNQLKLDNTYSNNPAAVNQRPSFKTRQLYLNYFFDKINQHWSIFASWPNTVILDDRTFHLSNVQAVSYESQKLNPQVSIHTDTRFIEISTVFEGEDIRLKSSDVRLLYGRLILISGKLYRNADSSLTGLLSMMSEGKICFPVKHRNAVLQELLLPLASHHNIELPDDLNMEIERHEMKPALTFKEDKDKFLYLQPRFEYGDVHFSKASSMSSVSKEDSTKYYHRDRAAEEEFFQYVRSLHPQFKTQLHQPYFHLSLQDGPNHAWFIDSTRSLLDKGVKLIGLEDLKKFKFNSSAPTWHMNVSNGIDWFDVNIKATWGDQTLGFKELKKAISNGQNFVILGDGSLGMIPDEWVTKYGLLLKASKEEDQVGKISKKQFGIIDLLYAEIDEQEVLAELDAKKAHINRLEDYKVVPISTEIKATLRPYQETGFQWMQVLDDISWGGCLADDMGLGKTLQAITFLQYVKEKYDAPTSLIVCPTSLIYNWQNELDKFAPDLKYHIFYSLGRAVEPHEFDDYDVIITSYGVARNDVETLRDAGWEYIILDESQTIKNPDAGVTRAMQLYKSRNKFILSGTPMQNNTFDLYAQFNFLNPGLLGTRDFFRNEFAVPIDKNSNKDVSSVLKTIIKPFMLRRTKSEVAIDLPEKTESILWCTMSDDQQELYDMYKDFYRSSLTQKIAADGIAKAGIYILEGLLRLRQICDDPRLLKESDRPLLPGVKIKELVKDIRENIGEHKILVFSQFTEMLSLIRQELDGEKIQYAYLDGSTHINKRKSEVDTFQTDENLKVFLISLKAGGVGLNLTAADYVYIVDPWWNPAVEQQAIDRVHRIGQRNNIFAYKMICKGTVEEKILTLQERKLGLTKDLVGEDNAFFKKLTPEDIQFLFS
jgi:SNF2 family DNA or RNA helicase